MEIFMYGTIDKWLAEYVNHWLSKSESPTLKINSEGGDMFAAMSIVSAMKQRGDVTVVIDGLAASAASLVAVAGKHVIMADNALMMIHPPSVILQDLYTANDLDKLQTTMEKIEGSILATYRQRVANFDLPTDDLWLTAAQAKDMGFVDEISGEAQVRMENNLVVVNSLTLKNVGGRFKMEPVMDREALRKEILQEERTRINALSQLKCDNAAVNVLIDVAINSGAKASDVLAYVDALKKVPPQTSFSNTVLDQLTGGASAVQGTMPPPDERAAQIDRIVNYVNGGNVQ